MRRSLATASTHTPFNDFFGSRHPVSLSWRRAIAAAIGAVLLGVTVSLFLAPNRYGVSQLRFTLLSVTLVFAVYAIGHDRALRRLQSRTAADRLERGRLTRENADLCVRERSARDELERSAALKNEFMATVTHELKTPLTSLLGYATILRRRSDVLSAEQRVEYFDIMDRQGQRILHLIEDLLQSSRMDAGVRVIARAPLNLQDVVRRTSDTFASMLDGHALSVRMPENDLGLFGDETAIEHVLTNLIENAIKYAPSGTAIAVDVTEAGPEVHVSVRDEGPGIAKQDVETIFERFRRSGEAPADRRSVGLGLYIVRGLLRAHGGRVWVDSEPGQGTTFTFALPRRARVPG